MAFTVSVPDKKISFPCEPNETVLDALALNRVPNLTQRKSWIARAVNNRSQKLPIDWPAILSGDTDTNYQLLPGDRLFFAKETKALAQGAAAAAKRLPAATDREDRLLEAVQSLRKEVQQLRDEIKEAKPAQGSKMPTRLDR